MDEKKARDKDRKNYLTETEGRMRELFQREKKRSKQKNSNVKQGEWK